MDFIIAHILHIWNFRIILLLDFTILHLLHIWTFGFLNNSFIGFYYFTSLDFWTFVFLYFPFWVSFSGLFVSSIVLEIELKGLLRPLLTGGGEGTLRVWNATREWMSRTQLWFNHRNPFFFYINDVVCTLYISKSEVNQETINEHINYS